MLETQDWSSPERLRTAVRRRTWAWLVAICRRLHASAEIVDINGDPCLPATEGTASPVLRRLLAERHASLLHTIQTSVSSRAVESAAGTAVSIVTAPLVCDDVVVGVLVLAGEPFRSRPPEFAIDLANAVACLAHAVETHVRSDRPREGEASVRIAAVHRAVQQAAARGSDRDVVLAFSEVLAQDDRLEVIGYTEDAAGRFRLAVESHSGTPCVKDETLDSRLVPDGRAMRPRRIADGGAGRGGDCDIYAARLGGVDAPGWVVVLAGDLMADDEPRLSLYIDLLEQAIVTADHMAETALVRRLSERLMAMCGRDPAGLLEELAHGFDAVGAALAVTAADGTPRLAIGYIDPTAASLPFSGEHAAATLNAGEDRALLTLRRPDGEPFTRHEQRRLDRVAGLFASWLSATRIGQLSGTVFSDGPSGKAPAAAVAQPSDAVAAGQPAKWKP